ncbi:MAG: helix-hairpin-helix domain-containing protein [Candidatus Eremiobacteraeota bacterium]|nr:helix-hairpin-helix domain-containing protein [Candidatus Eremiobacteraeota bacterium]
MPSAWSVVPGGRPQPHDRRTPASQTLVYVAGDVFRPGVYAVDPLGRVRDAVARAGGTRPDADLVAINLAAHLADGDEIVVPRRGEAAPARDVRGSARSGAKHSSHGSHRKRGHRRRKPAADGPPPVADGPPPVAEVDINSADAAILATVPGIGDGLAERIVAYRAQNGAFASVDELLDVAGITEHRLDALIPYVVAR